MKNKLLQISSDFADQKIYVNLVRELSLRGFVQKIYVPVRWNSKINGNRDDTILNTSYHYSLILKPNILFKLRYHRKLKIIQKDIEQKIELNDIALIHAHFLFSDGGVALRLKMQYGIPYVVSVRATDVHGFFPKMRHLRKFGNEIMYHAEKVIFINHAYKELFRKKYLLKSYSEILGKAVVIPNAIDDHWFESNERKKKIGNPVRILYVGRIIKRKKLDLVVRSVKRLNKMENTKKYVLEVVGDGEFMESVKKITGPEVIFHGSISDFRELKRIYERCHIFAMPAIKETFGLVYIEALSQGLPIIYCKNEGVDGFFEDSEVGVAVKANDMTQIISALKLIPDNYDQMSKNAKEASKAFRWDETTGKFIKVYGEALNRVPE